MSQQFGWQTSDHRPNWDQAAKFEPQSADHPVWACGIGRQVIEGSVVGGDSTDQVCSKITTGLRGAYRVRVDGDCCAAWKACGETASILQSAKTGSVPRYSLTQTEQNGKVPPTFGCQEQPAKPLESMLAACLPPAGTIPFPAAALQTAAVLRCRTAASLKPAQCHTL